MSATVSGRMARLTPATPSRRTTVRMWLRSRSLVVGLVIIESVFALPGMGSAMVSAILGRDYQVVQGFTLVYAVLVSVVYLLTDVAYALIDPRISL